MGTDTEVGCLRTVAVHRPGAELRRITPRTRSRLRFDGVPWVWRAQQEHDALTELLRARGTEVLYVTGLLQDVLEYAAAREAAIASVLAGGDLGDELGRSVAVYLAALAPEDLAYALVAGVTRDELRSGHGLVCELLDPRDFVVEPLPNLVFSRDASVWIGDQAVVATLADPRRREADLMSVIYAHHPRFAGLRGQFRTSGALDGGDLLLLAPGVVAVGVGARTTPASAERLARHLIGDGTAHTMLAVPMSQREPDSHLDRVCTVVDSGTVVMIPALAFTLTALTVTSRHGELCVSRPRPFLEAVASAIGVDRLTVIDTGLDSLSGPLGQWDDGGNALALGQRVTVCSERNGETNARLEAAGFEVVTVPCGELGAMRGGPRSMCLPIERDPVRGPERSAGYPAELATAEPGAVPAPAEPVTGRSAWEELARSR